VSAAPAARLDRLLANLGYGSRREVGALIAAGKVTLDGAPVRDAGAKIALALDLAARMAVRGAPLDPPAPFTLVVHKPLGVVCSHREAGRSLYELFQPRWRARTPALSSVGRLDKETSGLLLVTDDGDLLHRIISPRRHIAKRYRVCLDRPMAGHEGALFAAGTLVLDGAPLAPAKLEIVSPTEGLLTITEGRYHQVRRMFSAVGLEVVALCREAIGALDLPADLAPGAYRPITPAELAAVFASVEP